MTKTESGQLPSEKLNDVLALYSNMEFYIRQATDVRANNLWCAESALQENTPTQNSRSETFGPRNNPGPSGSWSPIVSQLPSFLPHLICGSSPSPLCIITVLNIIVYFSSVFFNVLYSIYTAYGYLSK